MAEFTLEALKDEIEADPEAVGYKNSPASGDWQGDQVVANLINAKDLVIDRDSMAMAEIRTRVPLQAFKDLLNPETDWLRWQSSADGVWPVNAEMKLQLTGRTLAVNGVAGTGAGRDGFWGGNSSEQDALGDSVLPMVQVPGSRAQVLWGERRTVSTGDIGRAFNLI